MQHVVSGEVRRHSELIHELELVRQFVPGCIEAEETVAAVERNRKPRASRTAFFAMALGAWRAVTTVGAITPMTITVVALVTIAGRGQVISQDSTHKPDVVYTW